MICFSTYAPPVRSCRFSAIYLSALAISRVGLRSVTVGRLRRIFVVVKQNPYGWRIGIVVLPGFVCPEESAEENEGDEYAAADKEEDNAHDLFLISRCFEA